MNVRFLFLVFRTGNGAANELIVLGPFVTMLLKSPSADRYVTLLVYFQSFYEIRLHHYFDN